MLKTFSLAVLLCSTAAQAEITVYTDRNAFLAAVGKPGVDTYDDLSVMLYNPSLDRMAGSYGYTVSASGGLYGAGAPGDAWLSTNEPRKPIVFSGFASGVNALGGEFFGSDVAGSYVPNTSMLLTAKDGSTLTYTIMNSATDSFIGFVSTSALQSVTLGTDGGNYWPTVNNLTLAAPVPEPGTYGMLLAGLGLVGWIARRRT